MIRVLPFVLAALLVGTSARAEDKLRPYAAVSLEESWDSNVLGSRGDDAVTRLTPRAGLMREGRRLQLGLDYRVGLHAYAAGTADSSINHRGSGWARLALDPRFELDTQVLVLQADDPIAIDRPGVAIPPGGIFETNAATRLTGRLSRRINTQVGYAYRRSRFDLADGPMPLAFDGDEHRADARATWRATRRVDTSLAMRGQYFVAYGAADDEVAAAPLAGTAWRATRRIRLSLEAGPVLYVPIGGGASASYLGEAGAAWTGERLRAGLLLLRDFYGGTGAPQAIWSEQLTGVIGWRAGHRAFLRLSSSVGRQGAAPNGPSEGSTLSGRGELRIGLTHNLRIDLFAEHRTQDAGGGLAFGDVQRTVAGVRLIGVLGTSLDDLSEVP